MSLTVVAVVACAHTVSTSLRRDQVATRYARITGYMATRSAAPGGTHTEQTPGAIRHDVILDEATLAMLGPDETCVDVVVRTDSSRDEPLDQYRPRFEIDGHDTRGVIENELVSVYDYTFTGEREVASIEGVAADQFIGMSVSKPTEQVFRVIERKGRICGGRGGASKVKLDITHPSWNVADYHYHIDFLWQLE